MGIHRMIKVSHIIVDSVNAIDETKPFHLIMDRDDGTVVLGARDVYGRKMVDRQLWKILWNILFMKSGESKVYPNSRLRVIDKFRDTDNSSCLRFTFAGHGDCSICVTTKVFKEALLSLGKEVEV